MRDERLILTIDGIEDYLKCRRMWWQRHHNRLTNGEIDPEKLLEQSVKQALTNYHFGLEIQDINRGIKSIFRSYGLESGEEVACAISEKVIELYSKKYGLETAYDTTLTPLTSFIVPLKSGRGRRSPDIFVKIKIDLVCKAGDRVSGRLWYYNPRYSLIGNFTKKQDYSIRAALTLYALYQRFGSNVDSLVVRAISHHPGETFFVERIITQSCKSTRDTIIEAYIIGTEIRRLLREENEAAFYRSGWCRYHPCEFEPLCASGDAQEELSKYRIRT
jgi:hypothetical protein